MLNDQKNLNNNNNTGTTVNKSNIRANATQDNKSSSIKLDGKQNNNNNASANPRKTFNNSNAKPGFTNANRQFNKHPSNNQTTGTQGTDAKKPGFKRNVNSKGGFGNRKPGGQYNRSQQPYQYPFSKVILTKRVDKVVSGGRNSSFVAIVVVGNCVDRVGVGTAGGKTIVDAIAHAKQNASNRVIVPSKIKYLKYKHCATEVIIKRRNVDIIRTAGYISSIFKACGLKNISCKIVGSNNPMNTIYAVFNALTQHIQFKRNNMILKSLLKQQSNPQAQQEA